MAPDDATTSHQKTSEPRRVVVLLVDDQPIVGIAVGRLLAAEPDIDLHCCHRAVEAVERANEIGPTVILQDLVMPDIDGLQLVELYRANPRTAQTPVIILSGNEDELARTQAFAVGATDFLVKLPSRNDLIASLRRHRLDPGPIAAVVACDGPSSVDDRGLTLDPRALAALQPPGPADSSAFLVGLIDQFLAETASCPGALRRAVEVGDAQALKATAHSVKGTSKFMGAARLAALCAELEADLQHHPGGRVSALLMAAIDQECARVREAFVEERDRLGQSSPRLPGCASQREPGLTRS